MAPARRKIVGEAQMVIPDYDVEAIARVLFPALQAFYASPKGQAAFEKWKQEQENT